MTNDKLPADLRSRYPGADTFTFGDNRVLCDELLALVRAGHKTATCGAVKDFETSEDAYPEVGRCDVALDWDGKPALVIRTLDVTIRRYCDVDESFALAEGETETLDGWREAHRIYFERNGGFDKEMELVCERFELVEDLVAAPVS